MKKIFFALLCTFTLQTTYAQFGDGDAKTIRELKNRITLVLIVGDSIYDSVLKKSFEENWRYNTFKIIKEEDLSNYMGNPGYAVFTATSVYDSRSYDDEYKYYHQYDYIPIRKKDKRLDPNIGEAYGHLKSGKVEDYLTRLPLIVNSVNNYLTFMSNYSKNKVGNSTISKDHYLPNSALLKKKTLLISKEDIGDDCSLKGIKLNYPYDVIVVDESEISEAIVDRDDSFAVLHCGINANSGVGKWFVYDCSTYDVISYMLYGKRKVDDDYFQKLNTIINTQ